MYVSRVKWSNPGKGVAPSPTLRCSSYWKGSLLVANFTYFIRLKWFNKVEEDREKAISNLSAGKSVQKRKVGEKEVEKEKLLGEIGSKEVGEKEGKKEKVGEMEDEKKKKSKGGGERKSKMIKRKREKK